MKYKSYRIVDRKPRWIIVDENGSIIYKSPSKDELKDFKIMPSKSELYSNREYLIKCLQQFYNKKGRVPIYNDFTNDPRHPSSATYWRIFGSWNNAIKDAGLWQKRYNSNHTCDRCGKSFDDLENFDHPRREYDEKGKWTGNWDCSACYRKYDPNSIENIRKSMANIRSGEMQYSETWKGEQDVDMVCELFGYTNLNKKYNRYNAPIDCLDERTGLLYQVQGRRHNSKHCDWPFNGLEREWYKEYESMICICRSSDGSRIEEIYIFPSWVIIERTGIDIYKSPTNNIAIIPWYEEYRIKGDKREKLLEKANHISRIKEEIR